MSNFSVSANSSSAPTPPNNQELCQATFTLWQKVSKVAQSAIVTPSDIQEAIETFKSRLIELPPIAQSVSDKLDSLQSPPDAIKLLTELESFLGELPGSDFGIDLPLVRMIKHNYKEPQFSFDVNIYGSKMTFAGKGVTENGEVIGAGGMGRVVFNEESKLAMKVSLISNQEGCKSESEILLELNRRGVKHSIGALKIEIIENVSFILMKEFGGIDIVDFLAQPRPPKFKDNIQICCNIAEALLELHKDIDIIHRDIKPDNILIDPRTLEIKIVDFGFAKKGELYNGAAGTLYYVAPEVLSHKIQTKAGDTYSFALTIYPVLFGKLWRRVPQMLDPSTYNKILEEQLSIDANQIIARYPEMAEHDISPLVETLNGCVIRNLETRFSMNTAFEKLQTLLRSLP